jgi:hypothetical protein
LDEGIIGQSGAKIKKCTGSQKKSSKPKGIASSMKRIDKNIYDIR